MTEEQVRAIFLLAGIAIKSIHKIENRYWPDAYVDLKAKSPWWLIDTEFGLIEIGWRKRVIQINWENTHLQINDVTSDDVTKDEYMVHAWSLSKAVEYLTNWVGRASYTKNNKREIVS